jgi:hypothetical protein
MEEAGLDLGQNRQDIRGATVNGAMIAKSGLISIGPLFSLLTAPFGPCRA